MFTASLSASASTTNISERYQSIKEYAESFLESYGLNVNLSEPHELYNFDDTVDALLFTIPQKGYIIVNTSDYSIPEFSLESDTAYCFTDNYTKYYNGPTEYYELVNNQLVDERSKISYQKDKLKNGNDMFGKTSKYVNNRNSYNSVTKSLSVSPSIKCNSLATSATIVPHTINYTLPNFSYNPDGICGSTASAMYLMYYDQHINGNYVPDNLTTSDGVLLIKYIKPYIDGSVPGSYPGDIEIGMYNYLQSRGISRTFTLDNCSLGYVVGFVASNKPYVVTINNSTYGQHVVAGYGYEYDSSNSFVIVNDGWGNRGICINMLQTCQIIG